ncbi:hypothetical protein [Geobacillus kaustophilus]|uniref:hypothetical protein n=1 Tax=Geobacillus kaustophilus TaxID=1462 RepID=UPI0018CD4A38|nr:hypothetical protein [Geobacillus kaustophilus]
MMRARHGKDKLVQFGEALKRQFVIRQLLDMGITEHQGKSIYDLDYYTLRHVLVMEKVKR